MLGSHCRNDRHNRGIDRPPNKRNSRQSITWPRKNDLYFSAMYRSHFRIATIGNFLCKFCNYGFWRQLRLFANISMHRATKMR